MLLERSLKHTAAENKKYFKRSSEAKLAEQFLEKHPLAKILVVIDTHSDDNGYFTWRGGAGSGYESCSLLEVSTLMAASSL